MQSSLLFTGTQVNYYFVCPTKLWLFSHHIQMEQESELVELGKLLNQYSYSRSSKDYIIEDRISIDFIKRKKMLELHEIKKSSKIEQAHLFQMLYYLFYLKTKGVLARGVIDYPKLRKRKEVVLTPKLEQELKEALKKIKEIVELPTPPEPQRKRICRKCSYFELCFGD